MTEALPKANFTLSSAAKAAIEELKRDHDARFSNPASVFGVSWGRGYRNSDGASIGEGVAVGFYTEAQRAEIEHGIQIVSGVELVFFVTPRDAPIFAGKILEFATDRGFYLREP